MAKIVDTVFTHFLALLAVLVLLGVQLVIGGVCLAVVVMVAWTVLRWFGWL
jgi:hypothetical protein